MNHSIYCSSLLRIHSIIKNPARCDPFAEPRNTTAEQIKGIVCGSGGSNGLLVYYTIPFLPKIPMYGIGETRRGMKFCERSPSLREDVLRSVVSYRRYGVLYKSEHWFCALEKSVTLCHSRENNDTLRFSLPRTPPPPPRAHSPARRCWQIYFFRGLKSTL